MANPLAYPGYPTKRLVIEKIDKTTTLTLPDGEWSTGVFVYPTLEQQDDLRAQGYELDDFGRPLHPWLHEMLRKPNVGVVTGLGEYWRWGPNRTADPIVINTDAEPKILLIQRADTGSWALPGGFIDGNESTVEAARRELFEETGLTVTDEPQEIYSGVVADARTTAHAWPETTALLWRITGTPDIMPNDDARDARWFPVNKLPDFVHGSHAIIIDIAVKEIGKKSKEISREVKGGHMLYRRALVTTDDGIKTFVKRHDKHAFTDPVKERHSKQYLHKEKKMYDHVSRHGFKNIPVSVALTDDHILTMDAFDEEDGWHWKAPEDAVDRYINDVIQALDTLQTIPLPDDFHDTILPTHQTHTAEGWAVIDDKAIEKIRQRIKQWQPHMHPEFQIAAARLSSSLPNLAQSATSETDNYYFAHHDLRQANVAWHPEHGAKIIDWSWAGPGRKDSDLTTMLIDLHKSNRPVDRYMHRFNEDHAHTLIGFWLAHSLWPTRTNDDAVRMHQIISAVSAYDLLMKYRQR